MSSTKFVFFGPIRKTRWPLIGRDIFDFSSETAEPNSTKLDRKQDLMALYHVCVFRADRKKQNGRPGHLIGWDIFDFSTETAERNSTKLDWKQALNAFYHVSVFQANRGKKQNGRPGLWLAETFLTSPLKPLKGIRQNLIGSKISTPSTKFVFFRWIGKQNGCPGLWFAETLSTFSLKPLNRIQQNLTGSKISTSSTWLAFFGLIRKTR